MNEDFKIGDYVRVRNDAYCPSYSDYVAPDNLIRVINILLDRNKTYTISKIVTEFDSEWLVLNGIGPSRYPVFRLVTFDPDDFVKDVTELRKRKLEELENMKKLVCSSCGSNAITTTKKMEKTLGPKNKSPRLMPPKRVTYGRVYFQHVCECGNTWEEETHL